MAQVIVERSFEQPAVLEDVQALENAVAWCLEQYQVTFLRTYFARDRRFMVCFYEAPDAEAVRRTQQEGKLPFDRIWTANTLHPPGPVRDEDGFEHVIVQRNFPDGATEQQLLEAMAASDGCYSLYRVLPQESYASPDGRRVVCWFRAPDAEAVRFGNQKSGVPFERAWSSTLHVP